MRKAAVLVVAVVFGFMALPQPARAGQATGVIHAGTSGVNVMLLEMQIEGCSAQPRLQGLDGWVLNVSSSTATKISVTGRGSTAAGNPAGYDLNLIFLNSRCDSNGLSASPSPNEVGRTIPPGTRYVLVQLAFGAEVAFDAYWTL